MGLANYRNISGPSAVLGPSGIELSTSTSALAGSGKFSHATNPFRADRAASSGFPRYLENVHCTGYGYLD